ncbi:flagellar type III secretion system pore protein FliP [Gynuella sp.]|uniref:flagellar type III secretion system pore protein FliP n=1 Tax=Gynuella sp. TaxID=2969146 RepID=UPI003D0E2581
MKSVLTILFSCIVLSSSAMAENFGIGGLSINTDNPGEVSQVIQILLVLTVLSLAPGLLIVMTSFTRIILVLAILRQALGMQQTPPNTVLVSLALFLTLFTMMPVIDDMNQAAYTPYQAGELSLPEAVDAAKVPLKRFMIYQTREEDLELMLSLSGQELPDTLEQVSFIALVPAFMLSEMLTAFQIGFIIFLPFLLVDLVVAAILMSMGMLMVPPMMISLPIKLLLFVLIDGWNLITRALVGSFS